LRRVRQRPAFPLNETGIDSYMGGIENGGIGNVVVNTVVRMFTRKAVGRAMKSAKSASGEHKKGSTKGKKGAW
jgi:hypothetical protein